MLSVNKNIIFIDAETDGLYGKFISVAMLVADSVGNETDRLYVGIRKELLNAQNDWVKENVIPILGNYAEYDTESELLEAVWSFWIKHRDNSYCIADVTYPVECHLFEKCVSVDIENRNQLAPFPLMDLSSMLYAKGINPLTDRLELSKSYKTMHNAMNDIEMSLEIWKKYIKGEQ